MIYAKVNLKPFSPSAPAQWSLQQKADDNHDVQPRPNEGQRDDDGLS